MKRLAILLSASLLATSAVHPADPPLAPRIDAYLRPYIDQNAFSGVVFVAKGDEVLFEKAYGMANYEFGVPNRPDTRFAIASITKRFTGIILLKLIAAEKLALDDKLSKWAPDFPSAEKITVEHLARHRSGVRDPDDLRRLIRMNHSAAAVVDHLKEKPLGSEPGETYSYTTANYAILGHIIERVTGKSFDQVVHQYVYEPAGMKDSGELTTTTVVPRLATGYMPDPYGRGISVCGPEDTSWKIAGGSSYSTARDLHRFARAFYRAKLGVDPAELGGTSEVHGRQAYSSNGSFPGAGANLLYFPEEEVTLVVLTNNYATIAQTATRDIAGTYFGEKVADPTVKLASKPAPMDPRVFGAYEVEGRTWTFTIALEQGAPVLSYNAMRKSALRRIDGDTWFSPLDWAKFRLRFDEAGQFEGAMILPGDDEGLKLIRR